MMNHAITSAAEVTQQVKGQEVANYAIADSTKDALRTALRATDPTWTPPIPHGHDGESATARCHPELARGSTREGGSTGEDGHHAAGRTGAADRAAGHRTRTKPTEQCYACRAKDRPTGIPHITTVPLACPTSLSSQVATTQTTSRTARCRSPKTSRRNARLVIVCGGSLQGLLSGVL